jgi:hypothetical protein
MTARQLRRAAERAQRKADRKAGFPTITNNTTRPAAEQPPVEQTPVPETESDNHAPDGPEAALPGDRAASAGTQAASTISEAQLAANRANARLSKGGLTPESRAISAQNHTIHGLARHTNGNFKLLESEDPETFASSKQALLDEHLPTSETETILVHHMAESNWLSQRAQRLQDTCMDLKTGAITDKENFNLYLRYYNTHNRNFYKALQQLTKLRADQRKAEFGVEAQRVKQDAETRQKEKHTMKKIASDAEIFIKEMVGLRERGKVMNEILTARRTNPEFIAELDAELTKIAFAKVPMHEFAQAA